MDLMPLVESEAVEGEFLLFSLIQGQVEEDLDQQK